MKTFHNPDLYGFLLCAPESRFTAVDSCYNALLYYRLTT